MKTRRVILLLEILTFAVVIGIIVWQVNILPDLRFQIESGLNYSLEKVARQAAEEFSEAYKNESLQGARFFEQTIDHRLVSQNSLPQLRPFFKILAGSQPLSESWMIVFPDTLNNQFNVFEYKYPNRYRLDADLSGSWRTETELCKSVSSSLQERAEEFGSVAEFGKKNWENSLDSSVVLVYRQEFNAAPVMGLPIFDQETGELKALIFSMVKTYYLENYYIPNYFNFVFWPEDAARERLRKRYLRFGVTAGQGDQLVYNSVAFGRRDFEHGVAIPGAHASLLNLRLGVGFRNTTVPEVAQSIYDRNLVLIFSLLGGLMLMLLLVFRTVTKSLRLSRLKSDFIANVSHEIKTPIASIKLAHDTLALGRARSPEQQKIVVKIIGDEVTRLEYLVKTILDFSHIETGRKKYKLESQSTEMLSTKLEQVARRKVEMSPGFELKVERKLEIGQVLAESQALEQVLIILLDNAIKYSRDKKMVTLRFLQDKKFWTLEVKDRGKGISGKDLDLIFDKFVRLESGDVHNVKGHGIGLSIAKAIVEAHQGEIDVKSKLGEGSSFFVKLPLQKTGPVTEAPKIG